jgi:hypothetical protein
LRISDQQVADKVRVIQAEVDAVVVPDLKAMQVAVDQAKVMSERIFGKYSFLFRERAGMNLSEATAMRANYQVALRDCEPIELARIAQRVLDEGSPASLILADCILRENFRRPKLQRSFTNASLLDILQVPEYKTATGLLRQVVDLHNAAGTAYATFGNRIGQASIMRISMGLAKRDLELDEAGGIIDPHGAR